MVIIRIKIKYENINNIQNNFNSIFLRPISIDGIKNLILQSKENTSFFSDDSNNYVFKKK